MVDYDIIVKGNNLGFRGGYFALANATLILSEDGPILFDTGHYCNRPSLLSGLAKHGLAPADVTAVFLSHLHFDHCNNVDLFTQAKVYVSEVEWNYVEKPHADDMFVPWLIREQLRKHRLELISGEGEVVRGVRFFPAPGHTPGSYALSLRTRRCGCVVLAGDALKYPREAINCRCDMVFDTAEAGSATIRTILDMADRIVPGHFPELIRQGEVFTWEEAAELPVLIR
jgi:glyoxylase-like metal-dependent hydrolase (beta-lactamase superfamily II)